MKIALVVNRVTCDLNQNIKSIFNYIEIAFKSKSDIIIFPETSVTGLINNDNPQHDYELCFNLESDFLKRIYKESKEKKIYISIGTFEIENNKIYDSVFFFDPEREIPFRYRRISNGWHSENASKEIYCEGDRVEIFQTRFGKFSFLICGDLFEDNLVNEMKKLKPDFVIVPFARCFEDGSYDQRRWDEEEKPYYVERVKLLEIPSFLVNYIASKELDGGSFGGAMFVSDKGEIIKEYPLGQEGILFVEI